MNLGGDGVEQVGLAQAGGAVDEQRVVGLGGIVGHGQRRAVGEAVGGADHEFFKGELRVKFDEIRLFVVLFIDKGVALAFAQHHQLDVGVEQLAHGVADVWLAAALNHIPPELRRREKGQLGIRQLHHLRIVKPGGDDRRGQMAFQIAQNLGPHIGGGIHGMLLSWDKIAEKPHYFYL